MKKETIERIINNATYNRADTVIGKYTYRFDAETARNGGGYSQPEGGCVLEINGDLLSVEVSDTSCGDFGSRVSVEIDAPSAQMRWGVAGLELGDLIRAGLDAARTCARGGAR